MDILDHIPSLPELALKYGTINRDQFSILNRTFQLKKKEALPADFESLLLSHKYATAYQVGLLKLIQEYLIIKKHGQEFGQIAIEKGFATQADIDKALEMQHKAFKTVKIKRLIGDILVESRIITAKQKEFVLKEQTFLDRQVDNILKKEHQKSENKTKEREELSPYEKQFLQIKVLDQEFAASVIEKGFATEPDVKRAKFAQEKAFERDHKIQSLSEIMVSLEIITADQKRTILAEQNRRKHSKSETTPPTITVDISQNQMEATVSWEKKEGTPVCLSRIKKSLKDRNIIYGIYPDAFLQCHLEVGHTEFIAAKQDFSMELIKSRKATYLFDTDFIGDTEKKRGETLAEQGVSCGPVLKKNLFGKTIAADQLSDFTFRCGSGVRLSKDGSKVFAGKSGYPSLSIERKLFIHPVLNLLEDADLKYGPLEPFANLNIKGVLTGAYPIKAGHVQCEEIRSGRIEAIGNVTARIGITDAIISAQGDIRARYLHNCRIETFGNIYIENEIIDSVIFSSGKIESANCHVIGSRLYAKKGIFISQAGNERTPPCVLGAGTEHHILEKASVVEKKIKDVRKKVDVLLEKKQTAVHYEKKCFQKMVELKMFHDRAKTKKEKLTHEFKKIEKDKIEKDKLKNIVRLISSFDKRMKTSIASLKDLNQTKKKYEKEKHRLESAIKKLEPDIKKEIEKLKTDLFAFFEWSRKQQRNSQIKISRRAFPGTILCGAFTKTELTKLSQNIHAWEKEIQPGQYEICFTDTQP